MSRGDCPSARSTTRRLCPGLSSTRRSVPRRPVCASWTSHPDTPSECAAAIACASSGSSSRRTSTWHPQSAFAVSMSSTPSNHTTAEVSSCGRISLTIARRGISSTGGTNATSMPSSSKKGRPDALRTTSPPSRFFAVANQATSAQVRTIRQAPHQRGCRHEKPPRVQACG